MNNFSWSKAIGYGAIIWLIIFAFVSGLVGLGLYGSVWVQLGIALLVGILAYVFAQSTAVKGIPQALSYGIIWVIIGLLLDLVVTMRFEPAIFSSWTLWIGYALTLLAPLAVMELHRNSPVGHAH